MAQGEQRRQTGTLPHTPFSAKPGRKAASFSDMTILYDVCRVKATRWTQAVLKSALYFPSGVAFQNWP